MGELSESLREVMRGWPTGVAVVCSSFEGHSHGMTVNSLASVSLDPPVIVVSLANFSRTCKMVTSSRSFSVSLLNENQQHIADIFSGKIPDDGNRFEGIETEFRITGAPILQSCRGYLDCVVRDEYPLPNSTIFIAEIKAAASDLSIPPLVYLNRAYRKVSYE